MPAPRSSGGNRSVRVEGLEELLAKLTPELYEAAGKQALKEIADAGAQSARGGAPRMSGKLAGSVRPKVNPGAKPAWAAVTVGALSPRGYSYPRLLEFSPKHHHQNWLKSAIDRAKGSFAGAVGKAASMIERKFSG